MDDFKKILGDLLYEKSLTDLERETIQSLPTTTKRQYATDTIQVSSINIVPYTQTGELLVKAVTKNNDGGKTYDTQMLFDGVKFENEDTPENITFTASDGEQYHIVPITATGNEVKVRCNCLDFYYRFALWNFNDGSLYGKKPAPYRRKTDNYPPVNPQQTPGLCKHLMKLADALTQSNILTP